jgi:uncharacterized protein (DUF983 family)
MSPLATMAPPAPRSVSAAMLRGFRCRCPNCGQASLFRAYLKVIDRCPVCGEDYSHQRADDAPPYFVMLITGHVIVPLVLLLEVAYSPPLWVHAVIWGPLTVAMALGLLQPIKGAIVGWQWANRMHGFDPNYSDDPV